jgi:hypothetical protein
MQLDLTKPVLDHNDKPIVEAEVPVTMGTALKRALITDVQDAKEKLERFELFLKVKAATLETEFSAAEVALLDKAIASFPTLIYGRLSHFLSQKL